MSSKSSGRGVRPSKLQRNINRFDQTLLEFYVPASDCVGDDDDRASVNSDAASEAPADYPLDQVLAGKTSEFNKLGEDKEREQRELDEFSRVFSEKCEEKLRVSTGLARGLGTLDTEDGSPKLAELFDFPGFNAGQFVELPNRDFPMKEVLEIVLAAQSHLSFKKTFEKEVRHFFLSDASVKFLTDVFWHFFLEKYQPLKKGDMQSLFDRLSQTYVELLWMPHKVSHQLRNAFFKMLPDLVAQTVYACFCHSFPASWRQFNNKLIVHICATTFLWISGCKGEPDHFKRWSLRDLEPLEMRADSINAEEQKNKKTSLLVLPSPSATERKPMARRQTIFEVQTLPKGAQKRKRSVVSAARFDRLTGGSYRPSTSSQRRIRFQQISPDESPYAYKPDKDLKRSKSESTPLDSKLVFSRALFDTESSCPLLANYMAMNRHHSNPPANRTLITHTHLTEAAAAPATETYASFVAKNYSKSRLVSKEVDKKQKSLDKETAEMWRRTNKSIHDVEQREPILLANKNEVTKLSNLLVLNLKIEPSERSTEVHTALRDALNNVQLESDRKFAHKLSSIQVS